MMLIFGVHLMNAMAQGYGAFAAEMLRVGDVLHAVDGKSVLTEPIKSIHGYTIGAEGSLCTLRVSRGSEAPFDVKVTRLALRDHGRQRDFMFAGPQYGCHYTETRALIAPTPRDEESELGAELQERMRSQDAQIKQLTRKLEDSRNESAETIAALRQKLHETQEDAYRASAELVSATAPLSAKDKEIEQLNAKLADLKQAHDGCESTVSELEHFARTQVGTEPAENKQRPARSRDRAAEKGAFHQSGLPLNGSESAQGGRGGEQYADRCAGGAECRQG